MMPFCRPYRLSDGLGRHMCSRGCLTTHTHSCMHTYTHIHMHTHTHTHTDPQTEGLFVPVCVSTIIPRGQNFIFRFNFQPRASSLAHSASQLERSMLGLKQSTSTSSSLLDLRYQKFIQLCRPHYPAMLHYTAVFAIPHYTANYHYAASINHTTSIIFSIMSIVGVGATFNCCCLQRWALAAFHLKSQFHFHNGHLLYIKKIASAQLWFFGNH